MSKKQSVRAKPARNSQALKKIKGKILFTTPWQNNAIQQIQSTHSNNDTNKKINKEPNKRKPQPCDHSTSFSLFLEKKVDPL